jgi:Flp pilus assembly protein TadD
VAEYEAVCRLQPNTAMVHYNLAYGLQLAGRRDEARAQYQEAIRLDPNLARRAP